LSLKKRSRKSLLLEKRLRKSFLLGKEFVKELVAKENDLLLKKGSLLEEGLLLKQLVAGERLGCWKRVREWACRWGTFCCWDELVAEKEQVADVCDGKNQELSELDAGTFWQSGARMLDCSTVR
jgi:hypothetical protein